MGRLRWIIANREVACHDSRALPWPDLASLRTYSHQAVCCKSFNTETTEVRRGPRIQIACNSVCVRVLCVSAFRLC